MSSSAAFKKIQFIRIKLNEIIFRGPLLLWTTTFELIVKIDQGQIQWTVLSKVVSLCQQNMSRSNIGKFDKVSLFRN